MLFQAILSLALVLSLDVLGAPATIAGVQAKHSSPRHARRQPGAINAALRANEIDLEKKDDLLDLSVLDGLINVHLGSLTDGQSDANTNNDGQGGNNGGSSGDGQDGSSAAASQTSRIVTSTVRASSAEQQTPTSKPQAESPNVQVSTSKPPCIVNGLPLLDPLLCPHASTVAVTETPSQDPATTTTKAASRTQDPASSDDGPASTTAAHASPSASSSSSNSQPPACIVNGIPILDQLLCPHSSASSKSDDGPGSTSAGHSTPTASSSASQPPACIVNGVPILDILLCPKTTNDAPSGTASASQAASTTQAPPACIVNGVPILDILLCPKTTSDAPSGTASASQSASTTQAPPACIVNGVPILDILLCPKTTSDAASASQSASATQPPACILNGVPILDILLCPHTTTTDAPATQTDGPATQSATHTTTQVPPACIVNGIPILDQLLCPPTTTDAPATQTDTQSATHTATQAPPACIVNGIPILNQLLCPPTTTDAPATQTDTQSATHTATQVPPACIVNGIPILNQLLCPPNTSDGGPTSTPPPPKSTESPRTTSTPSDPCGGLPIVGGLCSIVSSIVAPHTTQSVGPISSGPTSSPSQPPVTNPPPTTTQPPVSIPPSTTTQAVITNTVTTKGPQNTATGTTSSSWTLQPILGTSSGTAAVTSSFSVSTSVPADQSTTSSAAPYTVPSFVSQSSLLVQSIPTTSETPTTTLTNADEATSSLIIPTTATNGEAGGSILPSPTQAGIPSGVPTQIFPNPQLDLSDPELKSNYTLISLLYETNAYGWLFVANSSDVMNQLFAFTPQILVNAVAISQDAVKTYALEAWTPAGYDGSQTSEIGTVFLAFVPNDVVDSLTAQLPVRTSAFYQGSTGITKQLSGYIDGTFPLLASQVSNPLVNSSPSGGATGSNGDLASSGSSSQRRNAIIGVCVTFGVLGLIVLGWWLVRMQRRRRGIALGGSSDPFADSYAATGYGATAQAAHGQPFAYAGAGAGQETPQMGERRRSFFYAEDEINGFETGGHGHSRSQDEIVGHAGSSNSGAYDPHANVYGQAGHGRSGSYSQAQGQRSPNQQRMSFLSGNSGGRQQQHITPGVISNPILRESSLNW